MRARELHWRLGRTVSGLAFGFVVVMAGMGATKGGGGEEIVSREKPRNCPPARSEFNICFPHLTAALPNTARCTDEGAPDAVESCVQSACAGTASEPVDGFFAACCKQGGARKYEEACVNRLFDACEEAMASYCSTQCASLVVLRSGIELAPPTRTCLDGYPTEVRRTCARDPFCCENSWDEFCASALNGALEGG